MQEAFPNGERLLCLEGNDMLAEFLNRVRAQRPMVHCITNYVTANDCANMLLACGGSAVMADDPEEAAEIAALSDALVLNLGTPNLRRIEAMRLAGQQANRLGRPVVLDPVGAGCSELRDRAALTLLEEVHFAAIRGNASEIAFLARGRRAKGGVEGEPVEDVCNLARQLARQRRTVVIVTGGRDIVTDGEGLVFVDNGHPMMRSVTGAGCMLSAVTGAFLGANGQDQLHAALAAVCAVGVCGETAFRRLGPMDGNAGYRNAIIDAMYKLTGEQLEGGARYADFCG